MIKRWLVIDIGPSEVAAAVYVDGERESILRVGIRSGWEQWVETFVTDHTETGELEAMCASANAKIDPVMQQLFDKLGQKVRFLEEVSVAKAKGLAKLYPGCPSIVVDIGDIVEIDAFDADGKHIGGATTPGIEPGHDLSKPAKPMGATEEGRAAVGAYHTMLGGIERIVHKMRDELHNHIKVVATGGLLSDVGPQLDPSLRDDLAKIVDTIEPDLALMGIYETLRSNPQ